MWESFKCECGRKYAVFQGNDPIENPACNECGSDNADRIPTEPMFLVDNPVAYVVGD